MRVERHGRHRDRHGEERVLRHLQADVQHLGGRPHPPRRRVRPHDGPPEQQRRGKEEPVLQTVQPLVLQRRVEQRREMAPPHDGREQDPCNHGEREEPDDAGMEEREDPAAPRPGGGGAQEERDRPRVQQERRRHQREQHVLDHVVREQRGVVALHPGIQRHQDRQQAQHPRDRPAPRNRVCGVSPVDPPHAGAPQDRSDDHGQPDEWIALPAEQEREHVGLRRYLRPMRQGRSRKGPDGQAGEKQGDRAGPRRGWYRAPRTGRQQGRIHTRIVTRFRASTSGGRTAW